MVHHDEPHHDEHHPGPPRQHGHKFPAERWERLLSPERHALLDPEPFLDRIGVRAGMTVADLGAGPGFFTLPLAARVGPTGTVYATDISEEMLAILTRRGLPAHVHAIHAAENRFAIPDGVVDLALLAFVLHELTHPGEFLAEVRRILRPHGRLVVLEWIRQTEESGPPVAERLSDADSRRMLTASGFAVTDGETANRSHYFLIASPARA